MTTNQTLHCEIHTHGPNCGHAVIMHRGHGDYMHEGHLDHVEGDAVEKHRIDVSATNPAACTPTHACGAHAPEHVHGRDCGHAAVPHGDHVDYVVNGHLHHPCDRHCDDHGPVTVKAGAAHPSTFLVMVGDAQRVRVVRAAPGEALELLWDGCAPTQNVRGLGQAPDIDHNSVDAVRVVPDDGRAQFIRDVSDRLHGLLAGRSAQRLLVIAPRSFADVLATAMGSEWPSRKGDVIHRDEAQLDDEGIRRVIGATLDAES